jgi:murein tripeptide amidase MpaA
MHLLHHLVTGFGADGTVTRALRTRTFYVVPRVNPDGAELALADHPRLLRSVEATILERGPLGDAGYGRSLPQRLP